MFGFQTKDCRLEKRESVGLRERMQVFCVILRVTIKKLIKLEFQHVHDVVLNPVSHLTAQIYLKIKF
jgi:hypothetical protein